MSQQTKNQFNAEESNIEGSEPMTTNNTATTTPATETVQTPAAETEQPTEANVTYWRKKAREDALGNLDALTHERGGGHTVQEAIQVAAGYADKWIRETLTSVVEDGCDGHYWDEALNTLAEVLDEVEPAPEPEPEPASEPAPHAETTVAVMDKLTVKNCKALLAPFAAITEVARAELLGGHMRIRAVDKASVVMVELELPVKGDGGLWGVNVENLAKSLKPFPVAEKVSVFFAEKQAVVVGEAVTKTVALEDPEGLVDPKVPNLTLPATIATSKQAMAKAIKHTKDVSDHVVCWAKKDGSAVITAEDGDGVVTVEIGTAESADGDSHRTILSLDYLKDMVNALADGADVVVHLGTDYPVRMTWQVGPASLTYLQAPRIEDGGDDRSEPETPGAAPTPTVEVATAAGEGSVGPEAKPEPESDEVAVATAGDAPPEDFEELVRERVLTKIRQFVADGTDPVEWAELVESCVGTMSFRGKDIEVTDDEVEEALNGLTDRAMVYEPVLGKLRLA